MPRPRSGSRTCTVVHDPRTPARARRSCSATPTPARLASTSATKRRPPRRERVLVRELLRGQGHLRRDLVHQGRDGRQIGLARRRGSRRLGTRGVLRHAGRTVTDAAPPVEGGLFPTPGECWNLCKPDVGRDAIRNATAPPRCRRRHAVRGGAAGPRRRPGVRPAVGAAAGPEDARVRLVHAVRAGRAGRARGALPRPRRRRRRDAAPRRGGCRRPPRQPARRGRAAAEGEVAPRGHRGAARTTATSCGSSPTTCTAPSARRATPCSRSSGRLHNVGGSGAHGGRRHRRAGGLERDDRQPVGARRHRRHRPRRLASRPRAEPRREPRRVRRRPRGQRRRRRRQRLRRRRARLGLRGRRQRPERHLRPRLPRRRHHRRARRRRPRRSGHRLAGRPARRCGR